MILSGEEIKREQGEGIIITPFDEKLVNPNSYNLRLNNVLLVYDDPILDMKKNNPSHEVIIPEEGLLLEPGRLYLGRTYEHTTTTKYVPMIEGRSSVGRLGLWIHFTAGFGDIGYDNYWTLEMGCIQPVRIYPFVEICQIYYHTIQGDFVPYIGKYNHQNKIQASNMYKDFE